MRMPVISMWQPWGAWVIAGYKTIETRTHDRFKCLVGKRIAIHSTAKFDGKALEIAKAFRHPLDLTLLASHTEPGIIGTAQVVEGRWLTGEDSKAALIGCIFTRRYGLVLSDVHLLERIPCAGKQGVWYYESELLR